LAPTASSLRFLRL